MVKDVEEDELEVESIQKYMNPEEHKEVLAKSLSDHTQTAEDDISNTLNDDNSHD